MSDYISEDNLHLILKFLPVKTLLQFRCVCKGWKQHIDSPRFAKEHLSVQNPRFFVVYGGRRYIAVDPRPRPLVDSLKMPIDNDYFPLVGTLHGVVCLYELYKFMLWNPSIHRSLDIPLPSFRKRGAFLSKHTCYGFWINPCTKEFKIMFIERDPDRICYLYSSIGEDWSSIHTTKLRNWNSCKGGPPLMIGGVAHWGGYLDEQLDDCTWEHYHNDKAVLCFDFVQESFDVIEMPDLTCYKTAPFRWKDTLSIVCWDMQGPCRCEVYSRQEDSWIRMFSFEVYESVQDVFWVMEDVEVRKKQGKRKREREIDEYIGSLIGKTEEDVRIQLRILASIITESSTCTGELVLDGSKTGTKTLRKGLEHFEKVNIAYDFVESLLFP